MYSLLVFAALASSVNAAPLHKRIAQNTIDSTAKWQQACLTAGGAEKCNPLAVSGAATLLAAAGPCDQQNTGDSMIDLAKTLNNDQDMIKFAQIFVQQPRNSPDSFSIPYCQQAPKNSELDGLFQCQFQGTKDTFVGNLQPGAEGTVPFGLTSLATPKSCPANPNGGITDGTQLSDITQDPGLSNIQSGSGTKSGGSSSSAASATATATDSGATSTSSESSDDDDGNDSCNGGAASSTVVSSASATASASSSSSSFALQNGKDAQALNAKFASLTEDSSCQDGENACVGTSFAQCVGGKFVLSNCASASNGLTCAALPLVNSAGTSVTCTTEADATQRIANTGATGGITGSN